MKPNVKRPMNSLDCASLCRGVILFVFLAVAGLSYLYLNNQLNASGKQRKALEQELHELVAENNVMDTQIVSLKSPMELRRKVREGIIKLVPIAERSIVHIRAVKGGGWVASENAFETQVRTISHEPALRR